MRLTPRQLDLLYDRLAPKLGYLMKLERRLIEIGDKDNEELLALVRNAQEGMHRLCVGIHYMACGKFAGHSDASENVSNSVEAETKPDWITRREV